MQGNLRRTRITPGAARQLCCSMRLNTMQVSSASATECPSAVSVIAISELGISGQGLGNVLRKH